MVKKYIVLLALAKASALSGVVTLDSSWPVIAENLPVTVNRMQEFKNDCLAYMAGLNPSKPMVYPNCNEWADWHTNLFRLYAVSLEGLLVNFLQTLGGEEFTYGNNLVDLFNCMEEVSQAEVNDCLISVSVLEDNIQSLESTKATTQSLMQQKLLTWVDVKLLAASGGNSNADSASLDAEILSMATSIAQTQASIEAETFLKNTAWVQGITVQWAQAQIDAQNTLLSPSDVELNKAIAQNLLDQKVLVVRLENVSFAVSRVHTLSSEANPSYSAGIYSALLDELNSTAATLNAALTQKRIDMDEGLLGGTYNPEDYANPVVSSYVPQQVKFVSFPCFISCWNATNYGLVAQEVLDARNLDDGIVAII